MEEQESCDLHEQAPIRGTGFLQFTAIIKDYQKARLVIEQLSTKKIIACAQIQKPHTDSDGLLDNQWHCRFKSSENLLARIHSELDLLLATDEYDLTVSPIVRGSDTFLQWLKSSLIIA